MISLALFLGYVAVTGHGPGLPLVLAYFAGLLFAGRNRK